MNNLPGVRLTVAKDHEIGNPTIIDDGKETVTKQPVNDCDAILCNINDIMALRLNELGYQLWKAHDDKYLNLSQQYPLSYYQAQADKDGFVGFTMWGAMSIFGDHLHIGMTQTPFIDNTVYIEKRDARISHMFVDKN